MAKPPVQIGLVFCKLWLAYKCKFIQCHKFNNPCVCLSSSQSEREECETEYKQKYERERILLTEENKKLSSELEKVQLLFILHMYSVKQKLVLTHSCFINKSPLSLVVFLLFFFFCFLSFVYMSKICVTHTHTLTHTEKHNTNPR